MDIEVQQLNRTFGDDSEDLACGFVSADTRGVLRTACTRRRQACAACGCMHGHGRGMDMGHDRCLTLCEPRL
eukprot:2377505-Prymnesium_polylepis.3